LSFSFLFQRIVAGNNKLFLNIWVKNTLQFRFYPHNQRFWVYFYPILILFLFLFFSWVVFYPSITTFAKDLF